MKKTLQERIESLLAESKARKKGLEDSRDDYGEKGHYEEAAKCDIKIDQFVVFIYHLEQALKG